MNAKTTPYVLLTFALLAVPSPVSAGGLVLGDLPGSIAEDLPVCADSTTGRLGPCDAAGGGIARIAWVAKDGTGDYADPVAAMNDLATWCGTASAAAPCVLRIGPGTYTVTEPVSMAEWVTVEGSGVDRTIVQMLDDHSFSNAPFEAIDLSAPAAIRRLTIQSMGGNANVGININQLNGTLIMENVLVSASDSPSGTNYPLRLVEGTLILQDATVRASGHGAGFGLLVRPNGTLVSRDVRIESHSSSVGVVGLSIKEGGTVTAVDMSIVAAQDSGNAGTAVGIDLEAGDTGVVRFDGLEIDVQPDNGGDGVFIENVSDPGPPIVPWIRNAVIEVSDSTSLDYGVFTTAGADVRITGSTVRGGDAALYAATPDSTQTVAHSLLEGGTVGNTDAFTCASVYTFGVLAALDGSCQSGL